MNWSEPDVRTPFTSFAVTVILAVVPAATFEIPGPEATDWVGSATDRFLCLGLDASKIAVIKQS